MNPFDDRVIEAVGLLTMVERLEETAGRLTQLTPTIVDFLTDALC